MSIISNRHSIVPFVAGKTQAMSGQRLAKVGYKSTKQNPAKYASVAVSVPKITEPLNEQIMGRMQKHMIGLLEQAQDGIVKSLYESADGMLKEVSDEEIGIDACLAYLEAESTGGRLTKELLEQWFTQNVAENLYVAVSEKLGFEEQTPEQIGTVNKHVGAYKALIASLSGGATVLNVNQINQVKKVFELASNDDEVLGKLKARVKKMEEPAPIAELLDL